MPSPYLAGSSEQTLQAGKNLLPWCWLALMLEWSPKPSRPRGQSRCVSAAGQGEVHNASGESQDNAQRPLVASTCCSVLGDLPKLWLDKSLALQFTMLPFAHV